MRKTSYLLLGLLFVVGAVGLASWRHVLAPSVSRTPSSAIESARRAPASRTITADRTTRAARSPSAPSPSLSTWDKFDLAINVLNAVVGLIGIWLAISGMRMQRHAATLQANAQAIHVSRRDA